MTPEQRELLRAVALDLVNEHYANWNVHRADKLQILLDAEQLAYDREQEAMRKANP